MPLLFDQLWVIYGYVDNRLITPLVFVLMSGCATEDYVNVLEVLESLGVRPPAVVLLDFELAQINAFLQKYGDAVVVSFLLLAIRFFRCKPAFFIGFNV